MKDIYEILNDIEIDENKFEEVEVSEIERERTKKKLKNTLNKEQLKGKKRLSKKKIAIVAAITLVCATTTIAIKPAIAYNIPIIGELFKKDLVSVNKQYADYIDMIGKTKSCEGIDVTFESAVADDNMLFLNFLVKNNNKEIKDDYTDALLIPTDMKVNGKEVSTGAGASWEFIDNNTIRVLKKIDWADNKLKNKMNVDITISELFGKAGDWGVKFFLDKSMQVENTFEKDIKTTLKFNEEEIEISKVIASPLTVTVKGKGEIYNTKNYESIQFLALDQNGNGLLWDGSSCGTEGAFNSYKWNETFISNNDMKGITIIPVHETDSKGGKKLPAVKLDVNDSKSMELRIDEDRSIGINEYFIEDNYLIIKHNAKYFGKDSLRQRVDIPIYVTVDDEEVRGSDDSKTSELYNKYNDTRYRITIVKVGSATNIKVGTYDGSNVKLLKDKKITVKMNK